MILGIDPGIRGAMVVITDVGEVLDFMMMPIMRLRSKNVIDCYSVRDFIVRNMSPSDLMKVCIELVSAFPNQGVASSFNFGRSFGNLEGVVMALGLPITHVTPGVWKRKFNFINKDKDITRSELRRIYPGWQDLETIYKGQAFGDAYFIARYIAYK